MELVVTCEITWGRTVRVWWAYFWRNILAIICATILGGIAGLIIGFTMGALGASRDAINWTVIPVSGLIGLALSVIPMRLILGKSFGEFRLVLISTSSGEGSKGSS